MDTERAKLLLSQIQSKFDALEAMILAEDEEENEPDDDDDPDDDEPEDDDLPE